MRRNASLEHLLDQQGGERVPLSAQDADVAIRLAAAEAYARLNDLSIPAEVAERVEARVRQRAALLQTERQLAQRRRSSLRLVAPRPDVRRALIAALALAVVLVLTVLGNAAVANSLPGDPLYGVKQWEQHIALAWTGDPGARASLQLTQLQQALADLKTSDAALSQALATVAADTRESQATVQVLPAGPSREALAKTLANTLQEERKVLHQLLSQVDWNMHLAMTQQLGALGEPIPTIAQVTMVETTDDTLILTVTGAHFAPGARLVIDGTPRGVVLSNTPTTLRVQVLASDLPHHQTYTLGVVNPDGTAAQIRTVSGPEQPEQPEPGDEHGTPGPAPGSTPEPGDGEHPATPDSEPENHP